MIGAFEQLRPFDWSAVRVDFPEAQNEIARNENIEDNLADQEREEARASERQFRSIYDNAKPAFDRLFRERTEKRPANVAELVLRLQIPGGAFWAFAANIYSRVGKQSADEERMRRFIEQCDPFRALMIAICAAQYDRWIRPQKLGPTLKSGRNDTFMAVCLPYCHRFITNDPGQLNCFREVATIAGLHVTVEPYDRFREGLLIANSTIGCQARASS
ncbi:MAG TPA: hypothetical protein VJN21_01200 [Candidatus Acidoferrales bacterium]|nr:hypothetical protein [Candidatus Acidoferrales bacterium]